MRKAWNILLTSDVPHALLHTQDPSRVVLIDALPFGLIMRERLDVGNGCANEARATFRIKGQVRSEENMVDPKEVNHAIQCVLSPEERSIHAEHLEVLDRGLAQRLKGHIQALVETCSTTTVISHNATEVLKLILLWRWQNSPSLQCYPKKSPGLDA